MDEINRPYAEAQASVIGSLLIDPDFSVGPVMGECRAEDFAGEYRTVFEAIAQIWRAGERIDPVAVISRTGEPYTRLIRDCMATTPTAVNAGLYARIVREQAALLALREIGLNLTGALTMEDARGLIEKAGGLISERSGIQGRGVNMLLADLYGWISSPDPPRYLPWGMNKLDELLTAEPGDFILLGADSSVGKTALALQMAWEQASRGLRVGFFSLETSALKLVRRLAAQRAKIPMAALKFKKLEDEHLADLIALGKASNGVHLQVYSAAGVTVDDIRSRVVADRLDVVYIDYVQLLSAPGRERWEIVTAISIALHTMAQALGVAVVGLSQITAPTKGDRSKPDKDALRESKQLKQDADVILMMALDEPDNQAGYRWLRIEKNKDGVTGAAASLCLRFDPDHMTFTPTDSRSERSWIGKKKKARTFQDVDDQEEIPWQT